MKIQQEKNIKIFDKDVQSIGSYIYSRKDNYSAVIATKRQTDEMVRVIKRNLPKKIDILDIGCGDGTFTTELFMELEANSIVGIDPAIQAIAFAKKKIIPKYKSKITYKIGDIYKLDEFKRNNFDLIVLRGVLHHLYQPKRAISEISKIAENVLIVEPNGYNPLMKVIEKASGYHIKHEETSYWPPTLNYWFKSNGYRVIEQSFFSIVPYFCNKNIAILLKKMEPFFERVPILRNFTCGTNLVFYRK